MKLLEFIFSGPWVFIGSVIILVVLFNGTAAIILALWGK